MIPQKDKRLALGFKEVFGKVCIRPRLNKMSQHLVAGIAEDAGMSVVPRHGCLKVHEFVGCDVFHEGLKLRLAEFSFAVVPFGGSEAGVIPEGPERTVMNFEDRFFPEGGWLC